MVAWSPEIANEFVKSAQAGGRLLDQMQLQELVYIAHGWHLAATGQPLTGDRPEALAHGPEYRRLAELLSRYGAQPIREDVVPDENGLDQISYKLFTEYRSTLDQSDRDWVRRIYREYGDLEANKLAALTRRENTPWAIVYAQGAGAFREISHAMVRAQFVELGQRFSR